MPIALVSLPGNGVDLTADTYATGRSLAGATTGDRLHILGRTAKSDGGQGLFTWVSGATTAVNDGFELSATGGIWRRADLTALTYEMFGAVPMTTFSDTSHDSTTAINACHAALPSYTTVAAFPRVRLLGLYGVSATINVHELAGVTFEGMTAFGEIASGYVWIIALDNTKHMFHVRGNRLCQWKNLRVCANTQTATRANALKSAFCLSSDIPTAIQQKLYFENVWIGNRDLYDGLGGPIDYSFIRAWGGEITGSSGNNDAHVFSRCNVQNVGVAWENLDLQSFSWVSRDCKVVLSDNVYSTKSAPMKFENIEADGMNGACFLYSGIDGTDAAVIDIDGFVSQTNFAEFAIINTQGVLRVRHAQIDGNNDPANINHVNATHPYFIVANSANCVVLDLDQCSFYAVPPVIDPSNNAALRQVKVRGGRPDTIAFHNYNSTIEQRIVFHWEAGELLAGGNWHLTDNDWAPLNQLLWCPQSLVPDPLLTELSMQTVRLGRRNVSACTDVKNISTITGTVSAGSTYTFTNALPIGLILGVSLHINDVMTGPTSINIGDGTTAARWGNKTNARNNAIPPEASSIAGFTDTGPFYNKSVGNVVLTGVGGTFAGTGGIAYITVHYIDFAQKYFSPDGAA